VSGQAKAFNDLKAAGEIDHLPRLLAVQAEGCKPIVEAFLEGRDVVPVAGSTLADSIRVGEPRNWRKALKALRKSGGSALGVSDREIIEAIKFLGRTAGVFAEPAGAAGFAGFLKALRAGLIKQDETAVVLVTGSGLKDPESLARATSVCDVDGALASVEKCL
jgi:threonine synthase